MQRPKRRMVGGVLWSILCGVAVTMVAGLTTGVWIYAANAPSSSEAVSHRDASSANQARFQVEIRQPTAPLVILNEATGQAPASAASCSTCHSTREPDFTNRRPQDLTEFHQGLVLNHGELSCLACHDPSNYDALRLADGTSISYANAMQLCAQCHASQVDDYQHGAHGGMTGYWDLSRGPRVRHHCLDCHDAHAPTFPQMVPTFKPRDRFLNEPPRDSHE